MQNFYMSQLSYNYPRMSKTNNDDENTKHASLALKTETMPSEDGESKNAGEQNYRSIGKC